MPADRARVLVTGAGGPSGVSILLRAWRATPVTMLAADIDPYAAGLYLVPPARRVDPAARRRPRASPTRCWRSAARERVDVVVPTVDTELLPLAARARALRRGRRAARRRLASATLRRLPGQVAAGRALPRRACACPATGLVDDAFDAAGAATLPAIVKPRSGSGSRGIRLARAPRGARGAASATARCSCRSTCPGPEYSLDVLARADGHVVGRRPARAAEGRLGHRRDRAHAARRAPRRVRPRGRPADRPDDGRERAGQGGRGRRPGAAGGQPALPGHDAADDRRGIDMPRLAIARGARHADPGRPAAVRGHRDGALLPGALLRLRRRSPTLQRRRGAERAS